jgi:hypothetical protein
MVTLMLLGSCCEEMIFGPMWCQMQCFGAECGHMVFYLTLLDHDGTVKKNEKKYWAVAHLRWGCFLYGCILYLYGHTVCIRYIYGIGVCSIRPSPIPRYDVCSELASHDACVLLLIDHLTGGPINVLVFVALRFDTAYH